jgi:hypothetical protein
MLHAPIHLVAFLLNPISFDKKPKDISKVLKEMDFSLTSFMLTM